MTSAGGTTAQFAGGFQSEVAWNGNGCDFGQPVTFTASVAPQAGSGTPAGTGTFKDGATTQGTGPWAGQVPRASL